MGRKKADGLEAKAGKGAGARGAAKGKTEEISDLTSQISEPEAKVVVVEDKGEPIAATGTLAEVDQGKDGAIGDQLSVWLSDREPATVEQAVEALYAQLGMDRPAPERVEVEVEKVVEVSTSFCAIDEEHLRDLIGACEYEADRVAKAVNPTNVFALKFREIARCAGDLLQLFKERGHKGIP